MNNWTTIEMSISKPLLETDPILAIPYLVVLTVATFIGFVGNIMLFVTFISDKCNRRVGNEFILNLAIADYCVISVANPLCIIGKYILLLTLLHCWHHKFDNLFVECGGEIFQQVIGIPMGTNCALLLADIFLYSYETEFIQTLIKSGKRHLAKSFNFTYRNIDDIFSLNNHKFRYYVYDIYPVELEIKT